MVMTPTLSPHSALLALLSLVLQGRGHEFASEHGIEEIKISLTHARDYAAANAVAMTQ